MMQRILIGVSVLLARVIFAWFVANAGVGMKAQTL